MKILSTIKVNAKHLPICCPNLGTPIWDSHPRVFINIKCHEDFEKNKEKCPYCGTYYQLDQNN